MLNDIRVYNYYDDEPLITRMAQIKSYIDKKIGDIHVDVDVDFTEVHNHLDKIEEDIEDIHLDVDLTEVNEKLDKIIEEIDLSDIMEKIDDMSFQIESAMNNIMNNTDECKDKIIDKIEESKPCLCKLATKDDVCHIIKHIENSKKAIIEEIDEKFVNLNDLVK